MRQEDTGGKGIAVCGYRCRRRVEPRQSVRPFEGGLFCFWLVEVVCFKTDEEGYVKGVGHMASVKVTLPDGSVREYEAGVTLEDIAGSISRSLQKAAVAGKINGRLVDLYTPVHEDA